MDTPLTHRIVALALSVAVTLGLFQAIGHFAQTEASTQLLVRVNAGAAART
jgi:hypothetical protein